MSCTWCGAPVSGASHSHMQLCSFVSHHHASSCECHQGRTLPPALLYPGAAAPTPRGWDVSTAINFGKRVYVRSGSETDPRYYMVLADSFMVLPKGRCVPGDPVGGSRHWHLGYLSALGPLTRSNHDQTSHFKGSPKVYQPSIPSSAWDQPMPLPCGCTQQLLDPGTWPRGRHSSDHSVPPVLTVLGWHPPTPDSTCAWARRERLTFSRFLASLQAG